MSVGAVDPRSPECSIWYHTGRTLCGRWRAAPPSGTDQGSVRASEAAESSDLRYSVRGKTWRGWGRCRIDGRGEAGDVFSSSPAVSAPAALSLSPRRPWRTARPCQRFQLPPWAPRHLNATPGAKRSGGASLRQYASTAEHTATAREGRGRRGAAETHEAASSPSSYRAH